MAFFGALVGLPLPRTVDARPFCDYSYAYHVSSTRIAFITHNMSYNRILHSIKFGG